MTTPLVLNWLVPEPHSGAGGDIGLFRIIRYLAEFGHDCQVYVVAYDLMNDYTTADVRSYVEKHFGHTPATYHRWKGTVGEADATIATFWPTVENLLALPNRGRRYYLVQDFEPSFYPDEPEHYERAERTYRAGLHCITLGPWLARLLRARYKATADHFDFAVDDKVYHPRAVARDSQRRIAFYARPQTPRRAYETGLAALQRVKERLPEVEICFFGATDLNPASFPVSQQGMLSERELAELFAHSDVGLVISLSNPSFVPLEMMACGCPVVEIASERWRGVLTHGVNAWLVDPTPAAIANGIVEVLANAPLRERLIPNGLQLTQLLNWADSARQVEAILLREARARMVLPCEKFTPLRYGVGAWTEYIFFAYDLIAQLKPKTLVELGTDRGESYFTFCQSALENDTGSSCFAIDHWRGDTHAGSCDETTFREIEAHNRAHYSGFSTLIRSSFDEAVAHFGSESIDLLHIDGHHTEEAVRRDLESWLPKLRPGGILLMHDIAVRKRDFGVWKVWADLTTHGRSFSFPRPPGLGVWEKPPIGPLPALLETFLAGPDESRTSLLEYYWRRFAELQAKIARQWRDGSIRSAPMAGETVVQIFWTSDGTYVDENSVDARIGHDDWREIAISLPTEAAITGLRIDFYSALTTIEIGAIEVLREVGTSVYRAGTAVEFEPIQLLGDAVRRSLDPFLIEVTGPDPQLHLPPFSNPARGLVVRLRLRVKM